MTLTLLKGTNHLFYSMPFEFEFVLCFLLIKFRLCIFVKNTIPDAQLASYRYKKQVQILLENRDHEAGYSVMKISSCVYDQIQQSLG